MKKAFNLALLPESELFEAMLLAESVIYVSLVSPCEFAYAAQGSPGIWLAVPPAGD